MANDKKVSKKAGGPKYKATCKKKFEASFTSEAPYYDKLSKGEAVSVDLKNKYVINWLANKIIVKEN